MIEYGICAPDAVSWWIPLAVLFGTFGAAYVLVGVVLELLRYRRILDHPTPRGSHTVSTPRGGGWGIVLTIVPAWLALSIPGGNLSRMVPIILALLLLAGVSWVDDRRGLNPAARLVAQGAAVAAGLTVVPENAMIFQGWLPMFWDRMFTGLAWLWFINLFNFMDGIDGLAGSEATMVGIGWIMIAAMADMDPIYAMQATAIIGAAAGFLIWNWRPAKVFMGDVGSVPLGFALGWMLIILAAEGGQFWAALILPLVFLADASITLVRRFLCGKPLWKAHNEHFYQRAVQRGREHDQVVRMVIAANVLLLAAAVAAVYVGWPMMLVAVAIVAVLFWNFSTVQTSP
ncbi:MAG: glycosyltransferase family 4 protein [Pseudomonadota bacterium]|nr:glycosyltransferase family 4 protein [Pseudomonadota bacterium]